MKGCVVTVQDEAYKCDEMFEKKLKKKIDKLESSNHEILDIKFSQSTVLTALGKLITRQSALIVYTSNK